MNIHTRTKYLLLVVYFFFSIFSTYGQTKSFKKVRQEDMNQKFDLFITGTALPFNYQNYVLFPKNKMTLVYHKNKLFFKQIFKLDEQNTNTIPIYSSESKSVEDITFVLKLSEKYHKKISDFKVSPDEEYIVLGYEDGYIRILKKTKRKSKYIYSLYKKFRLEKGRVTHLDISMDSDICLGVFGGKIIQLWSIQDEQYSFIHKARFSISGAKISADGTYLVFFDTSPKFYMAVVPKAMHRKRNRGRIPVKYRRPLEYAMTSFGVSNNSTIQSFAWSNENNQLIYFELEHIRKSIKLKFFKDSVKGGSKIMLDQANNVIYTYHDSTINLWNIASLKKLLSINTNYPTIQNISLINKSNNMYIVDNDNIIFSRVNVQYLYYHILKDRYAKKLSYAIRKWKMPKEGETEAFHKQRVNPHNLKNYIDYYTSISLNEQMLDIFNENKNSIKVTKKENGKYFLSINLIKPLEIQINPKHYDTLRRNIKNIDYVNVVYTSTGIAIKKIAIKSSLGQFVFEENKRNIKPGVLYFKFKNIDIDMTFSDRLQSITLNDAKGYFNVMNTKPVKVKNTYNSNPKNNATALIINNWNYNHEPCLPYSGYNAALMSSIFYNLFGVKNRAVYFFKNENNYGMSKIIFSPDKNKKNSIYNQFKLDSSSKNFIFCFIGRSYYDGKDVYLLPTDGYPYKKKKMFSLRSFFEWSKILNADNVTLILETTIDKKIIENIVKNYKDYNTHYNVLIANTNTKTYNQYSYMNNYYVFLYSIYEALCNKTLSDKNKDNTLTSDEIIDFYNSKIPEYKAKLFDNKYYKNQVPDFVSNKPTAPFFYY